MSTFERRVLAELRKLREAEQRLAGMYKTLPGSGLAAESYFLASLRTLDERMSRFETFLERVV